MSRNHLTTSGFLVWIVALAFPTVRSQQDPCDLQSCFPKLTTNSSKLNALLVFGIFEVSIHEKCLSFAKADQCFKSALETCRDSSYIQKRLFYVDSWQKAKRLFDYICIDEFMAFNEHQSCLRQLATSNGIKLCDSYFNLKSTGSSMCGVPEMVGGCVEREAVKVCPNEALTPKVVRMVDMFLSNMLNINSSACAGRSHLSAAGSSSETESHRAQSRPEFPSYPATAQPVHTFLMTRRRTPHSYRPRSTATPRWRKTDDEEEEEDDDHAAFEDAGLISVDRHFDRWYRRSDDEDGGDKEADSEASRQDENSDFDYKRLDAPRPSDDFSDTKLAMAGSRHFMWASGYRMDISGSKALTTPINFVAPLLLLFYYH